MKPTNNQNSNHWKQVRKGDFSSKKGAQYPAFLSLLLSDKKLLEAYPAFHTWKKVKKPGLTLRYNMLKIATVLVFGLFIVHQWQNNSQTITIDSGVFQKQLVLDDGSVIRLNAHSKLQYPSTFSKEERRVTLLDGEAFTFYLSAFGGAFSDFNRFKEMPKNSDYPMASEDQEKIMHVYLPIGNQTLMGSDTGSAFSDGFVRGNNFSISINTDNKTEADRLFNALAKGGQITMPLNDMFWGAYFGMLTDQFGVQWMVNCDQNE